jgi:hypothetical protein
MNEMAYDTTNLIDFTLVKLKRMREEARKIAWFEMVAQLEMAIELYEQGRATIDWVDGEPLLTLRSVLDDNQEK